MTQHLKSSAVSALTTSKALEKGLGFRKAGAWFLSACGTRLECPVSKPSESQPPSVYMIVSLKGDQANVIYVGKSSDGWRTRRRMHLGNRGSVLYRAITESLQSGAEVVVYERTSGWEKHFGFFASQNDAEEMALIFRFDPPVNRKSDFNRRDRFQKFASETTEI